MKKDKKLSFDGFLKKFPEIPLPVNLGENTHMDFSRQNDPIADIEIAEYIAPFDTAEIDEFTEFIACFRIPDLKEFQAIVYWRAGLMDYRYVLATYNKKGELIDQRVIAGMYSDGDKLTQSVATIDGDWVIHVGSGQSDAKTGKFDVKNNTTFNLELMPDGTIENGEVIGLEED